MNKSNHQEKEIEKTTSLLMGLEIHITLNSQKKIFNWKNTYVGQDSPNTKVGPWELGYPGFLPILNPEVLEIGLKLSTALKMKVTDYVVFERKVYNYFDLPKGYQITQKRFPFASKGVLPIFLGEKVVNILIESFHLEEDTAKSHYCSEGIGLDFNRSGNPLIELVTKPVFREVNTVITFIKQLQILLLTLDISEARMEKGQLRVDLNYSLKIGSSYSTPRYEIKNLNSFSNIKTVLQKEVKKHFALYQQDKKPLESSTLSFDEQTQETRISRKKKEYFFLPEFNIPPVKISRQNKEKAFRRLFNPLPWEFWKKIEKEKFSSTNEIIQHSSFSLVLKTLNFLNQKKRKIETKNFIKWALFCFNYIQHSLQDNLKKFKRKWELYLVIFYEWLKKTKDKETIKKEIQVIELKQNKKSPKKKLEAVILSSDTNHLTNIFFEEELLEELNSLWNDELSKVLDINFQKVFNYLLGKLKEKHTNFNVSILVKEVNNFLSNKIKLKSS